jgi:hypothetical protein
VKVEGRLDLRGFCRGGWGPPGLPRYPRHGGDDSPASRRTSAPQATVDRHCQVLDILLNVTPTKLDLTHNAGRHHFAA